MTIAFVDAHIHLWELTTLDYPWLTPPFDESGPNGSVARIARDFTVADYRALMADWHVVGAVHVDAGAAPHHALAETEWLEGVADAEGLPSGIIGFAALDDPAVGRLLERHAAHPRVRGIRQILNWHPDPVRSYTPRDFTTDEQWAKGYGLLARYGLSFDLQCYPGQMAGLARLIERHPDIPVIINHLGMPVVTDPDGIDDWRQGLRALAALPHVAIKLSGLGFIARDWTTGLVRPFLMEAIELFGTTRCMFASDVPTDLLFAPVGRYIETYRDVTAGFSEDERRDLFGRNANRIYRLGLDL